MCGLLASIDPGGVSWHYLCTMGTDLKRFSLVAAVALMATTTGLTKPDNQPSLTRVPQCGSRIRSPVLRDHPDKLTSTAITGRFLYAIQGETS